MLYNEEDDSSKEPMTEEEKLEQVKRSECTTVAFNDDADFQMLAMTFYLQKYNQRVTGGRPGKIGESLSLFVIKLSSLSGSKS